MVSEAESPPDFVHFSPLRRRENCGEFQHCVLVKECGALEPFEKFAHLLLEMRDWPEFSAANFIPRVPSRLTFLP